MLCSEIQHAHAVRRSCELAELRTVGVSVRARLLLHLQADQSRPPCILLTSGSVLAALRFANEAGQWACDDPGRLWQSSETWRKRCAAYEPCSSAGMKRLRPLLPRCRGVARLPNCGSESTLPGQIEEEKKREKERRALEVKQASIEGRTAKLDVSTRPTCFADMPCGRSEPSCRRRRSSSPCRPRLASDLEPNKAAGVSCRTFRILRSRRVLLGRRQANIEWVEPGRRLSPVSPIPAEAAGLRRLQSAEPEQRQRAALHAELKGAGCRRRMRLTMRLLAEDGS